MHRLLQVNQTKLRSWAGGLKILCLYFSDQTSQGNDCYENSCGDAPISIDHLQKPRLMLHLVCYNLIYLHDLIQDKDKCVYVQDCVTYMFERLIQSIFRGNALRVNFETECMCVTEREAGVTSAKSRGSESG